MDWKITNPRRNRVGGITCTVDHPEYGLIDFAALPDTGDEQAQAVWQAVKDRDDIAPYEPEPAPTPKLTPRQFVWMLAYTRLEEVWDAVEQAAKQKGDLAFYANLRAQRSSGEFLLTTTLSFVADPLVGSIVAETAPDADLSEEAITDAWMMAAEQTFESISAVPQESHVVTDGAEIVTDDGETVTDTPA